MRRFSDDFLDELFELGQSTVQKTTQAVKSVTLGSVQKAVQEFTGSGSQTASPADKGKEKIEQAVKKQNHTPLDFDRLNQHYSEQDQKKMADVKSKLWHYFNLEKGEEKKAIDWMKRQEEERKRKMAEEEQEKRRREEEAKRQAPLEEPKGKVRRSIFSPKKAKQRTQAETRAGAGKQ